jgi:4-hydroxymandelate oxidase
MPDVSSPTLLSLADYERAAAERMSEQARAYILSGAADEISMRDNEAAWGRIALRPRMLAIAGRPDPSVQLLGVRRPHPILIAPTAFASLAHPDGELGIARGAAATSTIMCLATLGGLGPAELAAAAPSGPRWFQLYVSTDRGVSRELMDTAAAHGYEALVVTVDRPVLGLREREVHAEVRFAEAAGATGGSRPLNTDALIDADLSWDDIASFAANSPLPVVVKGVLTAEDARLALEHGAAGVIVSNHGGRQLDTVLAGADALPEIADAVGDRLDVLVDGGIRRGTDIVKALALGARAVLIGRPPLCGLTVDGAVGAQRVIEILLAELENALRLVGAPRADTLNRRFVTDAPWVASPR